MRFSCYPNQNIKVWHTFQQVNRRFTTWLLAALLAFVASFTVPVAHSESTRAPQQIAWVRQSRPIKRTSVERREPNQAAVRPPSAVLPTYKFAPVLAIFSPPLFQRPPPTDN